MNANLIVSRSVFIRIDHVMSSGLPSCARLGVALKGVSFRLSSLLDSGDCAIWSPIPPECARCKYYTWESRLYEAHYVAPPAIFSGTGCFCIGGGDGFEGLSVIEGLLEKE